MEDVDLSVGAVGAHDILFDGLLNRDLLDDIVQGRLALAPFIGRNDLDDTRLHAVRIDFLHLFGSVLADLAYSRVR